ncbi:M48 family metallopeptidase [Haloarchaeobius sp. DYHT-AS-18]|uniref:M48 family metallopeptidase n=1 Tax=Haloarchaeobius sp. DYHT-AS-18 TaxID=3446117 RepID=UPI003EBF9F25
MSLVVAVLVHLLFALGWYVVFQSMAERLTERSARDPLTAARLRHLRRIGYATAIGANLLLARAVGTAVSLQLLFDELPMVLRPVVVGAGVFVFGILPSIAAVAVAVAPYRERVRHLALSAWFVLWWFVTRAVAVTLAVTVIAAFVRTVPQGWPRVLGSLGVVLLIISLSPVVLRVGLRTRAPTPAERERVADVLSGSVRLRIVDPRTRVGCAFAAGVVPGLRYVFVTETVFDLLADDELSAVLAHEVAHHQRGHVVTRFGLAAAVVLPLLVGVEFGYPELVQAVGIGLVPYAVLWFKLIRRTEFVADRDAAQKVGSDAMARALETLLAHRLIFEPTGTTSRLLDVHPAVSTRIDRLESPADI